MPLVLSLAAGLYLVGHLLKTPVAARWLMIAILFVAVLAVQIALPHGHPLREATGGSPAIWLFLGGLAAVGVGYGWFLKWAKSRVRRAALPAAPQGAFNDTELERYARHMMLREIGGPGQKRLKAARILVIGAGGLGSPALLYLAGAGVGTIGVIDDDVVDNSNLQRQIIHRDADIGLPKVFSAERAMQALNPFVEIRPYHRRLSAEIAADLFADYDLILDGTDNFETRYLVNEAAVRLGRPLISAALTQWEGQISCYDPANGSPCYACIFPEAPDPALVPSCAEAGVLGPLPGILGAMMAAEALKLIAGAGQDLRGRLIIHDALFGESRVVKVARRADCAVCGGGSPDA